VNTQDVCTVLFYVIGSAAVALAIGMTMARRLLRAAVCLMGVLLMSAGLYVLLGAEFLAGVQVLVYVGGIVILIAFATMLTHSADLQADRPSVKRKVLAALAAGAFLCVTLGALEVSQFPISPAGPVADGARAIGRIRPRRLRPAVRGHLAVAAGLGARRHRGGTEDAPAGPAFHQRRRPARRG
jgi:NADH-quinone oxidoreductase subunit J